ncbi:RNA-guided endonuclease InsQ/TnpB family protein [Thermaerobacillus caldiproteolyticus]|uniref:IS605 OrfB family transposase n=1 Tax=Thermaerobacillus caldiproteolyticus TaxID=247480 RepID=A0A7V9Z5H9_9BACL|nr:RNA-guided endonuclease TnpB family protein [Anoxybacillus caldiproteolyticus]MBA2874290.1 IS605 OrfB family transposase [Anoxybacillus caldiproteolyticus]
MKYTKVMRYQIIKPLNAEWDELGMVLRDIQKETRAALNKTIQLCWEYQGFSADYKQIHGQYPKPKDVLRYTSMHGYAYKHLKNEFSKIASANLAQTIKRAVDKWNSDLKEILRGDRSIPNFRKDCPIDIVKQSTKIQKCNDGYVLSLGLINREYKNELGRKNGVFDVLIKANDKTQQTILERIINGDYTYTASQIINHKNKWFINLTYQFEAKEAALDPNNVMGVDLGIVYPVYIAFNNSLHRYHIKGGEIERFRRQVEKRKRELLNQGKYCGDGRKGHGYATRTKSIELISDKIARFRDTCNHKYSRFIVDMALKHKCGIIQMEDLTGISKESTFLKNWTYYDLQQKIEYKAREAGIQVIKIEPQYTSQRCSKCGYIDKENRQEQATFKCIECGFKTNADYNAARNIAIPNIDKIIRKTLKMQ